MSSLLFTGFVNSSVSRENLISTTKGTSRRLHRSNFLSMMDLLIEVRHFVASMKLRFLILFASFRGILFVVEVDVVSWISGLYISQQTKPKLNDEIFFKIKVDETFKASHVAGISG